MFYTGAPQNTKRSTIKDNFTKQAQQLMQEHNIDIEKVIIHAPYIINLGNLSNINFSNEYTSFSLSSTSSPVTLTK